MNGASHAGLPSICARWRWALILAAVACFASSLPSFAGAARASAVSAYCAHIPASKVSAVVGGGVTLRSAVVIKGTLECQYGGATVVVILKEPGIPAADLATPARAEAKARLGFPAGTRIAFASLPALGASAFSWTATIDGMPFAGVGANRGTTGYGSELSGKASIAKEKALIALGMAV
ncbi:MAG TPA: hypothetical protein VH063_06960 [Gaiellaceae bacterium]|jgi:hypothetical protein|nr:hypothetical protein [Gaiellaceae bacterium]